MKDYMRARQRKAGKGTTLRLFCAECFLASSICCGVAMGAGWCAGCTGFGGSTGPYLRGDHVCLGPFKGVGGGSSWAVSGVESSVHAPHLPRFIQLGSFSDTLHVVSILDIVYDCH